MAQERLDQYRQVVRSLSDRIVEAQRPIRILDAIKWDAAVREAFFASDCESLPAVDRAYYDSRPVGFDLEAKKLEFEAIMRDIRRNLGQYNPLGRIMERTCREYAEVVRMIEARGRPEFSMISQQLYGSSTDVFHAGDPSLGDMALMLTETLANLAGREEESDEAERTMSAEQAVELLQERLSGHFRDAEQPVCVKLSDGIVSDAAAGADYIKLRTDARFSRRDLRVLEVHEGWVHLGTTLNGRRQPVCTFLSKGAPSSTVTQEGLATLLEIFSFASHPTRVQRLTDRVQAVQLAEQGADFLETFRHFRERGLGAEETWNVVSRVYRGSTPRDGPFTKDLVYSKGFVLIYNFIRLAVRRGVTSRIPLLFCGKCTLEDVGTLAALVEEGMVEPPRFVPAPFDDMSAVAAWMSYSSFLNRLDLTRIEADYASLLR